MKKVRIFPLVFFAFVSISNAQWSNDPTENNPICLHGGIQLPNQILIDDSGGAIIVWSDPYYNYIDDIFVQRINSLGEVDWTDGGVDICSAGGDQNFPRMITDGSGGAIIAWEDSRNSFAPDIYAQKINSSGDAQWKQNGVIICTADGRQDNLQIVSDGSGGAIITWKDGRSGSNNVDIYAQRINSLGEVDWTEDGVNICSISDNYILPPQIVTDDSGGAIIIWSDDRNGIYNTFAQKIDSSGEVKWKINGIQVSTTTGSPVVSDGLGGAIFTTIYDPDGTNPDIYAQKINSLGEVQWGSEGIAVCKDTLDQRNPKIVNDDSGGVIITWEDERDGGKIYAQRISSFGKVQWTNNGVPVSTAVGDLRSQIVKDGSGGVIVTWEDFRNGSDNTDIYAQKINSSGEVQWTSGGVPVSIAASNQLFPQLTNDASGGAIITWNDLRNGNDNADIYAQKVDALGNIGIVGVEKGIELPLKYSISQNYPNPFNPTTTIGYKLTNRGKVILKVYDVLGDEVAILVDQEQEAGNYSIEFDGEKLSSGVYFYKIVAGRFTQTKKMILLR